MHWMRRCVQTFGRYCNNYDSYFYYIYIYIYSIGQKFGRTFSFNAFSLFPWLFLSLKASKLWMNTCGIMYLTKKCEITENTSYILILKVEKKSPPFWSEWNVLWSLLSLNISELFGLNVYNYFYKRFYKRVLAKSLDLGLDFNLTSSLSCSGINTLLCFSYRELKTNVTSCFSTVLELFIRHLFFCKKLIKIVVLIQTKQFRYI